MGGRRDVADRQRAVRYRDSSGIPGEVVRDHAEAAGSGIDARIGDHRERIDIIDGHGRGGEAAIHVSGVRHLWIDELDSRRVGGASIGNGVFVGDHASARQLGCGGHAVILGGGDVRGRKQAGTGTQEKGDDRPRGGRRAEFREVGGHNDWCE